VEGKFDIADSIHVECEIGGELNVGSKLVIGEKGVVHATVQTVDAIIMGQYEGTMVATGNVEITATGRVSGDITTDSLVISKGGFFSGNVTKMNGQAHDQGPVYLVEDTRAALITGQG
jgi:cytoskeletal protein CcmA (bactofilin family)